MYFRYYDDYRTAVTAHLSAIPIILNNGENLNKPPYQALNYQPNPNIPPYTYVPIAIFNKVGSKVRWDATTSTIHVTDSNACEDNSIYYKQELDNLKAKYDYDTRMILTEDDLAYIKSNRGNSYGVFNSSADNKPAFRGYIDYSLYPANTMIKWFKIIEYSLEGRPHWLAEYIKPFSHDWMEI